MLLHVKGNVYITAGEQVDSAIVISADAVIEDTVHDLLPGSTVENISLYRSEFEGVESATVFAEDHKRWGWIQ
ncbi:MAG: hypothetical protein AB7R89_13380 [Dehalococcoidia bacterium]